MQIDTTDLLLRDFVAQDLPAYVGLRSHPDFQHYYDEAEVSAEKSAFLLEMFMAQSKQLPRTKFQLAICAKTVDNQASYPLIGSCGIRLQQPGTASLGFELAVPWQRQGKAIQAARAMLAFAFDTLPVSTVYADTLAANHAARRLCASLGMREVSTAPAARHFKGQSWDGVVYAIEADEFFAAAIPHPRAD